MKTRPMDEAADEFVPLDAGGFRLLVRRGYEARVEGTGLFGGEAAVVGHAGEGRQPHPIVELPDGERVVVREYRRGGAIRHLNPSRYFLGDRAADELIATERARSAGVSVPTVIAAGSRRARLGYTAILVTRWIPGSRSLLSAIAEAGWDPLKTLYAAGQEIGRLHAAGIAHPDLTVHNLLEVASDEGGRQIFILDFDRARVYPDGVPRRRRRRDLLRFRRSARKREAPIPPGGWAALREGYGPDWPPGLDLG